MSENDTKMTRVLDLAEAEQFVSTVFTHIVSAETILF